MEPNYKEIPSALFPFPCFIAFGGVGRPVTRIFPENLFTPRHFSRILSSPDEKISVPGPSPSLSVCDLVARLTERLKINQKLPTKANISQVMDFKAPGPLLASFAAPPGPPDDRRAVIGPPVIPSHP
jgi:hypothetical protein